MAAEITFVPSAILFAAAKNNLVASLPGCSYMSPPIVSHYNQQACLSFLVGQGEFLDPDRGYQIWPPKLLAIYNAIHGSFMELRGIKPSDFGLRDDPVVPLGNGIMPAMKLDIAYLQKQIQIFEAIDRLIPLVAKGEKADIAFKAYRALFDQTVEPSLLPYCIGFFETKC
jgi:hypothetical protein